MKKYVVVKKMTAWILTVVMLMSIVPAASLSTSATEPENYFNNTSLSNTDEDIKLDDKIVLPSVTKVEFSGENTDDEGSDESVDEEEEDIDVTTDGAVYVGGILLENGDFLANGSDEVTDTAPEGGYAHLSGGRLILNDFKLENKVYSSNMEVEDDGVVTEYKLFAGIYAERSLSVSVIGNSEIIVEADDSTELEIYSGIFAREDLYIKGSVLNLFSRDDATVAENGDVIIERAELAVESGNCGIYASTGDIYIKNSLVEVEAYNDGIDGVNVVFEGSEVAVCTMLEKDGEISGDDGIEAEELLIKNSVVHVNAADEGFNIDGNIKMTDSDISIFSLNDAIDSDGKKVDIFRCEVYLETGDTGITMYGAKLSLINCEISIEAVDTAIRCDRVSIEGTTLFITAGEYGIHCEDHNTYIKDNRFHMYICALAIADSNVYIDAGYMGIYVYYGDLTVERSDLAIYSETGSGIVCHESGVGIDHIYISFSKYGVEPGRVYIDDSNVDIDVWWESFYITRANMSVYNSEISLLSHNSDSLYLIDGDLYFENSEIAVEAAIIGISLVYGNIFFEDVDAEISSINNEAINLFEGSIGINNSRMILNATSHGINTDEASVAIDNSDVEINSDKNGIYISEGDFNTSESDIVISAGSTGISVCGALTLNDSDVEIVAEEVGIYSEGTLHITFATANIECGYAAIIAELSNILLYDSDISMSAEVGISIYDSPISIYLCRVEITATSEGIFCEQGDIIIWKTDLSISAGLDGTGICTLGGGTTTIEDSDILISSFGYGIYINPSSTGEGTSVDVDGGHLILNNSDLEIVSWRVGIYVPFGFMKVDNCDIFVESYMSKAVAASIIALTGERLYVELHGGLITAQTPMISANYLIQTWGSDSPSFYNVIDPSTVGNYQYIKFTSSPADIDYVVIDGVEVESGYYAYYDEDGNIIASSTKPAEGGYAIYNEGTLTLNNMSVSADAQGIAIGCIRDMDIKLVGSNTLHGSIMAQMADVNIYGSGSLKIDSESFGIYMLFGDLSIFDTSVDIEAEEDPISILSGNFVIDNCRLNVKSYSSDLAAVFVGVGDVMLNSSVVIVQTASAESIWVSNGHLSLADSEIILYTFDQYADNANTVVVNGNIDITDGTALLISNNKGTAIQSYENLTVSDSSVTFFAMSGCASKKLSTIKNSRVSCVNVQEFGIFSSNQLDIIDSTVLIMADGEDSIGTAARKINIYDSEVFIGSDGIGALATSKMLISGGEVEIIADMVLVCADLTITGGLYDATADRHGTFTLREDGYFCGENGDIITHLVLLTEKRETEITGVGAAEDVVYDGNAHVGFVGVPESDIDFYGGEYEIIYEGINGTEYYSTEAPKNAGSYRVTISIPEENLIYTAESVSFEFNILPKKVTFIWREARFIYDGEVKTPGVQLDGVLEGDVCNAVIEGATAEAGTHIAHIIGVDNPNYELVEGEHMSCEFVITDTEEVANDIVSNITEFIYNSIISGIESWFKGLWG